MIEFKPADRKALFARIALTGPSGSGKTYTALTLATALGENLGVIDTERGSASKYVGLNGWQFETVQPDSYSPLSLVETLGVAAGRGFDAVLIDSLSHYWMGADGMLEQVDRRAKNGGNFSGWKEVRPDERKMIDAIVSYPGHVIVTMRSKTEYVIEENDKGKKQPVKVGLKPDQREGIEYEFDLIGDMDMDNTLTVSKSRIHTLSKAVVPMPTEELAYQIRDWMADGTLVPTVSEYRLRAIDLKRFADAPPLYKEVEANKMLGAPTVDADGNPTILGDLVLNRGRFLKSCEEAEARDAAKQQAAEPAGQHA